MQILLWKQVLSSRCLWAHALQVIICAVVYVAVFEYQSSILSPLRPTLEHSVHSRRQGVYRFREQGNHFYGRPNTRQCNWEKAVAQRVRSISLASEILSVDGKF